MDEPIVVGYNVTYCLLDDRDLNNCSESPRSEVVILSDDDEMHQLEISGLKSYRLYNVSVALMSHTRLGIPKAPITVRTMEGGTSNINITFLIKDVYTELFSQLQPHRKISEHLEFINTRLILPGRNRLK